jgi:signal transduction histidine kinase
MDIDSHNILNKRDRYIKQLMLLNQIDEEINARFNLKHVLDIAMDASLRLSSADTGLIALLQGDGKLYIQKYLGQYSTLPANRIINDQWVYTLLHENGSQLIDLTEDSTIQPFFVNSKAMMILTLESHHTAIGVLLLETTHSEYFTQENFDFLKRISKRLAVALEHSQLYKELEGRYSELEQLYRKISRLEQLKTDMIRIAAHDIRSPVNAIMNYVEVLQRGGIDPERSKDVLEWIKESAQNAENITKNILSLEEIENIQNQVLVPTDLCKTIMASYTQFEQIAIDGKVSMAVNIPKTPVFVAGIDYLLQQAISNFVSNAIKYTPENGQVEINLHIEHGNAVVTVVDNGYGIPTEQQAALFQPFYRPQNNITYQISGTGLGLYLIKKIIESFNGEVFFTSKFGEGSTFGLKIPIYFR